MNNKFRKMIMTLFLLPLLVSCNNSSNTLYNHIDYIPYNYIGADCRTIDGVRFTVYTYTEKMDGVYFNSIDSDNLIVYVDDLVDGNNSIKISLKDDIVEDGFGVDYPGKIYLKSVEILQNTFLTFTKKYEISTYYYDCILYIKVER